MKIILLILAILFCSNVDAKEVFIRSDGGVPVTECDGTKDLPKTADKHCAFNRYSETVVSDLKSTDSINITKGQYSINVQVPPMYVSMTQFMASPKLYTDIAVSGRSVYIKDYNGRNFQIIAK